MDLVKLSKFLSLILRHEPEKFGIMLDDEGYVSMDELYPVLKRELKESVTLDQIQRMIGLDPEKKRFDVADGLIRANYGHSAVKVEYETVAPPATLFHGTNTQAVARIFKDGLKPMTRQYVHLTTDEALARKVGARRGQPRVVKVDAAKAASRGVKFYRPNDVFWLADAVPAEFLRMGL